MTKTIYYAHPMSWYNTEAERADPKKLPDYGRVVNSNSTEFQIDVDVAKKRGLPVMEIFANFIRIDADVVVFRRFRDWKLGAGVAREILEARIWGKEVWEIAGDPNDLNIVRAATGWGDMRSPAIMHDVLTAAETRARIERGEL